MSADSIEVCPNCYSLEHAIALTDITVDELNDESVPNEMRAYYEFYFDQGHVVVDYSATCWACNYHVEFKHEHPLPEAK